MKHFRPFDGAEPHLASRDWISRRALSPTSSESALILFLLVCAALPLLWPSVPPLVDVPNHISRYAIEHDYARWPQFRAWFEVHHVLVGNLGVDLIVRLLGHWMAIEPAVKLVTIAIPVLTVTGVILIAREVHGRVTPLTALAAVFAYNFPFNFGFLNFTLSMALALPAFGLWLRLGRLRHLHLRAALFVPIGCVVWLAHASGWGMLGLMVFGWEIAAARGRGLGWARSIVAAGLASSVLAAPLVPMLLWSTHAPGQPGTAFRYLLSLKFALFFMALRDGSKPVDALSTLLLLTIAISTIARRDLGMHRGLLWVAGVLLVAFLLVPFNLIGSAYADMRIAPYALMMLMLALAPRADTAFTRALAPFALLFFAAQMVYHSVNYARLDRIQQHQLEALDHIAIGSSVYAMAQVACGGDMAGDRVNHLHRLAIARRHAFTNGSWAFPSTQTILARPAMTAGYQDDDSASLDPASCVDRPNNRIDGALAVLPRDRFHYFWLIDVAPRDWPRRPWLHIVWHNDAGALYAIDPAASPRPA